MQRVVAEDCLLFSPCMPVMFPKAELLTATLHSWRACTHVSTQYVATKSSETLPIAEQYISNGLVIQRH